MKTIGLVGGMSWESTAHYYRLLNEGVKARLGGLHSAQLLLHSVDFAPIERMQREGRWGEAAGVLRRAVRGLEAAGADLVLLCANTMHKVADEVMAGASIPLLHIADVTADAVHAAGVRTAGLLGTRYTMEEDFYRRRLSARHGLEVLVPGPAERQLVNRVIFDELVLGVVFPESRARFLEIIDGLRRAGAGGIVAGCTEFGMLLSPSDCPLPWFDTTELHVEAALAMALAR